MPNRLARHREAGHVRSDGQATQTGAIGAPVICHRRAALSSSMDLTIVHAKGWTRQRAIDFLYDHIALTPSNVFTEIDLYVADPGQAASYMIGRREIDRLRADAARRLNTWTGTITP